MMTIILLSTYQINVSIFLRACPKNKSAGDATWHQTSSTWLMYLSVASINQIALLLLLFSILSFHPFVSPAAKQNVVPR